jgi:hypothetical protein
VYVPLAQPDFGPPATEINIGVRSSAGSSVQPAHMIPVNRVVEVATSFGIPAGAFGSHIVAPDLGYHNTTFSD